MRHHEQFWNKASSKVVLPDSANPCGGMVLAALLVLCGVSACSGDSHDQKTDSASTDQTKANTEGRDERAKAGSGGLSGLCESLGEGDNIFYGKSVITSLERRLETEKDPTRRLELQGRLAWESLRLDRVTQAQALIAEALAKAETTEQPASVNDQLAYVSALIELQSAEDRNCVENHSEGSCILPIAPSAQHVQPQYIRRAGDILQQLLDSLAPELRQQSPLAIQATWLLNVSRMLSGEHPEGVPESLRAPSLSATTEVQLPRWRNIAPALGIDAFDLAGGAVMDDFDGDGLLDVITSTQDPCSGMKAFRNDGEGGFEDVSQAWNLHGQVGGLNLVHADYDGDGQLDLLVLRGAWMGSEGQIRNSLLRNDIAGSGRFIDVTHDAGVADPARPTQTAAWADYDGDGDLDLYVANETRLRIPYTSLLFIDVLPMAMLMPQTDPHVGLDFASLFRMFHNEELSYPSQLFRNNGDGTFTDVAEQAGVTNMGFSKGCSWGDYDNDGDPDLFISNIGPNRLYGNNGDGTFTDLAAELGVVEPALASFATWFFDYDNDGDLDLFVADYSVAPDVVTASYLGAESTLSHAVLYRNDGGTFEDVSEAAGLTRPLLPMGANYGDIDNDGWLDIYLGTGTPDLDVLMPSVLLRNDAKGGYEDLSLATGMAHLQKGHGIAFGDLDNDGDQDVLAQMGGAYPSDAFGNALFENPTEGQSWITLRLEGKAANRFGVGARVELRVRERDGVRQIHGLVGSGGSFGSSSMQQELGLGNADGIESVTVRWPGSGLVQTFDEVQMNRILRIVEGDEEPIVVEAAPISMSTDHPAGAAHEHHAHGVK